MRKKLLAATVITLMTASLSFGENPSTVKGPEHIQMKKDKNRPTDIQDDNLTCVYIGGQLQFQFAQSEGSASVDVSKLDTGERITTQSNGYLFTVTMGDTPGFYQITVSTSEGSVYTGYLAID